MMGDRRVPYTIELDHMLTVIAEYADTTALDHVAVGRSTKAAEISPDRRKAVNMARWATEAVDVNPIPGSEELREEFFEAKKKLVASYGEKECPGCEIGKLIREFRDKLIAQKLLQ
jgi:hypothetical protein